ncbi:MAG: TAXI family TRAP transporter solute-binding subunit [Aquisalimonadaceae bacterium]
MKLYKKILAGVLFGAMIGQAGAQAPLGIGTSGQGSMTYSVGSAAASLFSDKTQLRAVVQPQAGTGVMVPLVNQGELDLGFAGVIEISQAYTGTGEFRRDNKNLRIVGRMFTSRVSLMVRADSDIRSIADLKGKTIAYGYTSTPVFRDIIQGILANGGLTIDDVDTLPVPGLLRGADEFAAGNVDAAFFAVGAGKVSQVDASIGGIRFLPLDTSDAALQRMRDVVPLTYPHTVEPSGALAGIEERKAVMGYDHVLFTGKHVSDDVIYDITRAIAGNKDHLVQSFGGFRGMDPKLMAGDYDVPLHDGAIRYYREAGLVD